MQGQEPNPQWQEEARNRRLAALQGQGVPISVNDTCSQTAVSAALATFRPTHVAITGAGRRLTQAGVLADPQGHAKLLLSCFVDVLEAIARHERTRREDSATQIVFGSTWEVYGSSSAPHSASEVIEAPLTVAGSQMASAELLLQSYAHLYGFDVSIMRSFEVYGPFDDWDSQSSTIVQQALRGGTVNVPGDGGRKRDFVYVKDAVAMYIGAMEARMTPHVANVAVGLALSWQSFAEAACQAAHSAKHRCVLQTVPDEKGGPSLARVEATTTRLIPLVPTSLEDGLRETIAWWKHERTFPAAATPPDGDTQEWSPRPSDFIFSAYFTSSADPQRMQRRNANRFSYMKDWYRSRKSQPVHDARGCAAIRHRLLALVR